jgi:asparagine synthase (glutamine-hydrolysing)
MDQIFTVWTTLPGRTAFEGVHELPAGHYLMVSNGRLQMERYWAPGFALPPDVVRSPVEELRERAHELLLDAVRIRLRADVTVGSYLSGGLDSSGVTALVAKNFDSRLRTFGIRFEDEAFDEGEFQRLMVSDLRVDHREIRATNADIASSFPDVIWHCEKPLLRTAPAPLFLLSRLVRENGIKVVLTGEGSDEFFGGYNIFREAKVRHFLARQPASARRALLLEQLYPYIFKNPALKSAKAAFFARGLDDRHDPLFSHRIRWDNTVRAKVFFSEDLRARIGESRVYDDIRGALPRDFSRWPILSQAQFLEISIFMSNYLLSAQGDRVAMAHSVEVRLPFLDHRLIEFLSRVPPTWKILGMREKHLLKNVFKGILPDAIVQRPKQPYRAPVSPSLLNEAARSYTDDLLSDGALRNAGFFDPGRVALLVGKARRSGALSEFDNMALAGILSTQLLHRQYVEQFPWRATKPAAPRICVDRLAGAAAHGDTR